MLLQTLFGLFGIVQYWLAEIACERLLPDPPYEPGYLAGVPWVLADEKDPKAEAPSNSGFTSPKTILPRLPTRSPNRRPNPTRCWTDIRTAPLYCKHWQPIPLNLNGTDAQSFAFSTTAVARWPL